MAGNPHITKRCRALRTNLIAKGANAKVLGKVPDYIGGALTDAEMENVSSLQRGQGLVCSSSAKLFVDFVAADYEKQEITTDAKSFYMQEKALKEKQHQEEQARLEVEDKKEPAKTDDNSEKR